MLYGGFIETCHYSEKHPQHESPKVGAALDKSARRTSDINITFDLSIMPFTE